MYVCVATGDRGEGDAPGLGEYVRRPRAAKGPGRRRPPPPRPAPAARQTDRADTVSDARGLSVRGGMWTPTSPIYRGVRSPGRLPLRGSGGASAGGLPDPDPVSPCLPLHLRSHTDLPPPPPGPGAASGKEGTFFRDVQPHALPLGRVWGTHPNVRPRVCTLTHARVHTEAPVRFLSVRCYY